MRTVEPSCGTLLTGRWPESHSLQVLFSKSLRDNIRYADPSASEAQVREAAARADALPFIEELPEKYDAVLATGMLGLSCISSTRLTCCDPSQAVTHLLSGKSSE